MVCGIYASDVHNRCVVWGADREELGRLGVVLALVGAMDFIKELVLRAEGESPDTGIEVVLGIDAAKGRRDCETIGLCCDLIMDQKVIKVAG